MPPALSGSQPRPSRPSRYASFAARLKDAHSALRDPRIPAAHRAELTKRVLTITALARHDVTVAATRLEGFFVELSGLIDTPSGKNTATQG